MIEQKKPHMGFLADESRLYICVVSNFRMCAPMYVTCDRWCSGDREGLISRSRSRILFHFSYPEPLP